MLRAAVRDVVISNDVAVLRNALRDADVIVVAPREGRLLRELWPHAARVRWVHALAAGVESLLFDELRAGDVPLTNSRGIFADALGEWALAAMLFFAKDLRRLVRQQDAQRWTPFNIEALDGATLGIVGFGGIGRAVARRAEAFGMRVVATRATPLDELLAAADYVVISTPLTPETLRLIGARELSLMKTNAVLINIGRGAVADEAALIDALRDRRIRGAALDVFESEPLAAGHPFWSMENVLLSPHCADHTDDAHDRTMAFFLENLRRLESGEALVNVVDKAKGY
ncbi:MAG: 2-hydroxyacid dehydrogenase [Acidobacteria bacterium]|nr:2-hydroxyacid dehydrogenase [Acidobacteriota bacterium]